MIDDGRIEGAYPELVELVSNVQSRMAEATEALCVQKMIDLNIDPDVVQLQALEIQRLRGLLQEREWIPVSERLPKESLGSVIGWDEHRKRCCFVQFINRRWILGNDIDSVKITAWMPLPEAYKGE